MKLATQPDNNKRHDKSFWITHFKEFKLTNLSKSEYARRNNIGIKQFFYWFYRFEKEPQQTNLDRSKSDFVAIKIMPDTLTQSKPKAEVICTLELGDHKRLYIHTESAMENVIKLLAR